LTYGKGASFLKQLHFVLGHDALKSALRSYFDKYAWQNTELKDFVGMLQIAYDKSPQKKMGPNFKLADWSDTWLKTSGVNLLEGVATYDKDSKIESFAVKQTFDSTGKNQLRQQVLNVAFYDQDFNEHVIENVAIQADA